MKNAKLIISVVMILGTFLLFAFLFSPKWSHIKDADGPKVVEIERYLKPEYKIPKEMKENVSKLFANKVHSQVNARLAKNLGVAITRISELKGELSLSQNSPKLINELHSLKYSIATYQEEIIRRDPTFSKTGTNEQITSLVKEIDGVYEKFKSTKQIDLGLLKTEIKVQSPKIESSIRPSAAPMLKIENPLPKKGAFIKAKIPMLFTIALFSSTANATEYIPCSNTFFKNPASPHEADSDYLKIPEAMKLNSQTSQAAQDLKTPFNIFKYVKEEIRYEEYVGAQQSAQSVYNKKSGNPADQANLLAAMLRVNGIPTRFVTGEILVRSSILQKLWGLESNYFSVFMNHRYLFPNFTKERLKRSYIKIGSEYYYSLPHVWLEAYIPFDADRGLGVQNSIRKWVPLDPSLDQYSIKVREFTARQIRSRSNELIGKEVFNFMDYLENPDSTGSFVRSKTADEEILENIASVLSASSGLGWSMSFLDYTNHGDLINSPTRNLAVGPIGTEACIVSKTPFMPDDRIVRITFRGQGIDVTFDAPEINTKEIFVVYEGATAQDQQDLNILEAGGVPSGEISVKAKLFIGEQIVATGQPVPFGVRDPEGDIEIIVSPAAEESNWTPGRISETVVPNGSVSAIILNLKQASQLHFESAMNRLLVDLRAVDYETLSYLEKQILKARALTTALSFLLLKKDTGAANIEKTFNVKYLDSIDIITMGSSIGYQAIDDRMLGIIPEKPKLDWAGIGRFIPRHWESTDILEHESVGMARDLFTLTFSSFEHEIFEDFFSMPGLSTVRISQLAKQNGISLVDETITEDSQINEMFANKTSGYSSDKPDQIRATIDRFEMSLPIRLILPAQPVSQGETSFFAFFIGRGNSSGGYGAIIGRENGGHAVSGNDESKTGIAKEEVPAQVDQTPSPENTGGETSDQLAANEAAFRSEAENPDSPFVLDQVLATTPSNGCDSVGEPVNLLNGEMWHIFNDIEPMSGPGDELEFWRIYRSQSTYDSILGYGWSHNYNQRLETADGSPLDFNQNQEVLFWDSENLKTRILFDSSGTPIISPAALLLFEKSNNEYRLISRNGRTRTFWGEGPQIGKIKSISDRNNNVTSFTYNSAGHLEVVTDSVGRTLTLSYQGGRLHRVTDFAGRYVQFGYDGNGDLVESTRLSDISGDEKTTYTYLSGEINSRLNHNMTSFRDPEGNGVDYFYYQNDKVFKHIEAANKETIFVFNPFSKETTVIDSKDQKTKYLYDSLGNITTMINPDSTSRRYKYNIQGLRIEEIDEEGFVTRKSYDLRGNLIKTIPPEFFERPEGAPADYGQTTITYHDKFDVPVSIKDGAGNFTDFEVDPSNGNVLSQTVYLGFNKTLPLKTEFTYAADGRLTGSTDARQNSTTISRNRLSDFTEVVTTTNASNDIMTQRFDAFGRVNQVVDFAGKTVNSVYDVHNQLISTQEVGSNQTQTFEYDKVGNIRFSKRNVAGHEFTTEFRYDELYNRIYQKNEEGEVSTFEFTDPGCQCGVEEQVSIALDGKGNETKYTYNWRGQPEKIVDSRGGTTIIKYDGRGNRTSVTVLDVDGSQLSDIRFSYNAVGLLETTTYNVPDINTSLSVDVYKNSRLLTASPTVETLFYDGSGSLIRKETKRSFDGKAESIEYKLNAAGLVEEKKYNPADDYEFTKDLVKYTYDESLNVTSIVNRYTKLGYTYDTLNRVATASSTRESSMPIVANYEPRQPEVRLKYDYDPMGRITQLTQLRDAGNVVLKTQVYDELARLKEVKALNSPLGVVQFSYDEFDRINRINRGNGRISHISSERTGRLKSVTTPGVGFSNYFYDNDGNIAKLQTERGQWQYRYDQSDQVIGATYDGQSNLPKELFSWDVAGSDRSGVPIAENLVVRSGLRKRPLNFNNFLLEDGKPTTVGTFGVGQVSYRYDFRGHLSEKLDLSDPSQHKRWEYHYDVEGRLVMAQESGKHQTWFRYDGLGRRIEKVTTEVGTSNYERVSYVHDSDNVLFEFRGANKSTYIGTGAIDNHLVMVKDDQYYYYHTDHLGSMTAISNSRGEVEQRVVYTHFGEIAEIRNKQGQVVSTALIEQPFYFTGRAFDKSTGLYYYRARYYDPKSGRFTSRDPIGLAGGDTNLFRYVRNNPISFTDPTGRVIKDPEGIVTRLLEDPRVKNNPKAIALLNRLQASPTIIEVGSGQVKGPSVLGGTGQDDISILVTIDTDDIFSSNEQNMVTLHELGHADNLLGNGVINDLDSFIDLEESQVRGSTDDLLNGNGCPPR